MKYKVKVDRFVKTTFMMVILMLIVGMAVVYFETMIWSNDLNFMLATTIIIISMAILLVKTSYYQIDDDFLMIKLFIYKRKIDYDQIKSLTLKKSYVSNLAFSLEVISIELHQSSLWKSKIQISPQNREQFLKEMLKKCHYLE